MIAAPNTYSEWMEVISILKNKSDDEEVLEAMKSGTIQWQSGVAERFTQKLVDAVNARMNAASDKFQLDMSRAHGAESAIVQAIISLRKEMSFLAKVMDLPAIPEHERKHYIALVVDQADNMQYSLEQSAAKDRSGKLSSIIRNHKVNSF
jgi:hypothetical protein